VSEKYLKAMRLSVERQVMIEAKVVDVTLNNAYQAGINWRLSEQPSRHRRGVRVEHSAWNHGQPVHWKPGDNRRSHRAYLGNRRSGKPVWRHCYIGGGRGGRRGVRARCSNEGFRCFASVSGFAGKRPGLVQPAGCGLNNQKAVLKVERTSSSWTKRHWNSVTGNTGQVIAIQLTPTLNSFFLRGISRHHTANRRGREYPPAYPSAGQQRSCSRISRSISEASPTPRTRRFPWRGARSTKPIPLSASRTENIVALGGTDEGRCRERPFRHSVAPGYPGRRRSVREYHRSGRVCWMPSISVLSV